jgi:DNA mismatch repair protein MutS
VAEDIIKTPLMKQYLSIKAKYPDAILLFRVGDFYETFSEDAIKTSSILGIALTKRANGSGSSVELAGFPHHALETYLPKLVRAGQRVAICEQLEDPKLTKNIVKRGITELVTPGVSMNDNVLERKENNFLACVNLDKTTAGLALLDISTGEFLAAEGSFDYIDKLLNSFTPKEVLFERSKAARFNEIFGARFYTYPIDEWMFTAETSIEKLLRQFDTKSLKGFGIQEMQLASVSAGAILQYLDLTRHDRLQHINHISRIEPDRYVWLDKFTIRNLELLFSPHPDAKTLLKVLDFTLTPMGGRMLKKWMVLPLKDENPIRERLETVQHFAEDEEFKSLIDNNFRNIGDLERIVSKIAMSRISPREIVQLKNTLSVIEPVKKACAEANLPSLQVIAEQFNPCHTIRERIAREIVADPPHLLVKGGVIADGISAELDELRKIAYSGKDYLLQIQQRESERSGIPSLKISYNNVFGYYFEVRNMHKDKVPEDWIRKQTLANAERYYNEELKEYESKILGAEEKIIALENKLFNDLVLSLAEYIPALQLNASLIARLDCLCSFAQAAIKNNYVRPEIYDSPVIDIKQGRHPVIEQQLPLDEKYIANDVYLDDSEQQIIIITGPNMAGKSALLRQTALIVLLAQMGSFVPADSAKIGLVDKIFTRVGASDNISLGESTFMVEMNEASSILNNISDRSLILFDELGRGTSTYDGISIAWAIVEYIHEHPRAKAKTLFATHYHELNEMEKSYGRIKNFNVSVKEVNNKVIFLRKMIPGGSEHSFGIHVAKLAGMPKSVVSRAEVILKELEVNHRSEPISKNVDELAEHREGFQLNLFQLDDPVLKQIRNQIKKLDLNNITPIEALNKLNEIKKLTGL